MIARWIIPIIAVVALISFFSSDAAAGKTTVDDYKEILATLERSNLDSIQEATKAYHKLFADKRDIAAHENAFDEWSKFVRAVIDLELGRIIDSGLANRVAAPYPTMYVEPREDMNPHAKKYIADLRKRGLAVQQAREEAKIVVKFSYIKSNFFPYLSDRSKSIMMLGNEYEEEDLTHNIDAHPERARAWIIKFEEFVKKYPSTFEAALQGTVQTYVLSGTEEGTLSPDRKKSFQQFLKENKKSRYYPLIKEYYKYLDKHQFRPNYEVARELLDKYNQVIEH